MTIETLGTWFRENYFTFERRVLGLDIAKLNEPIDPNKPKFINLLSGTVHQWDHTHTIRSHHTKNPFIESCLIRESNLARALRIASNITVIIPLIAGFFCLLDLLRMAINGRPSNVNALQQNWREKFIKDGEGSRSYHVEDYMNYFIDKAIESNIDPILNKESILIADAVFKGRGALFAFYQEDYYDGFTTACKLGKEKIKTPLNQRLHIYFVPDWWEKKFGLETVAEHPDPCIKIVSRGLMVKGSTIVYAPYPDGFGLTKPMRLYLQYLQEHGINPQAKD